MLNLDTHILLHAVHGKLTPHEKRELQRDLDWGIASIVLWEIEKLFEKGRIPNGLEYGPLSDMLGTITIWPLNRAVCLNLRLLDFHSDPADEIIAATSLTHNVPLLTRDVKLRGSKVLRCV